LDQELEVPRVSAPRAVVLSAAVMPLPRGLSEIACRGIAKLINVLNADMSLVGPRPPMPYEVAAYDDWHKLRLSSKPGITGLWQVSGRAK